MKAVQLPDSIQCRHYSGVVDPAAALLLSDYIQTYETLILLAPTWHAAERWASDLKFFNEVSGGSETVRFLPYPIPNEGVGASNESDLERLSVLSALHSKKRGSDEGPLLVYGTVEALMSAVPDAASFGGASLRFQQGEACSFEDSKDRLLEMGYAHEAICEEPGDFSIRGGIIDIYPVNADVPYRIDFFGDELDSIRSFDPDTQRSASDVDAITVAPFNQGSQTIPLGILDYLPTRIAWCFLDAEHVVASARAYFQRPERIQQASPTMDHLWSREGGVEDICLAFDGICEGSTLFGEACKDCGAEPLSNYRFSGGSDTVAVEHIENENAARFQFLKQINSWSDDGYKVHCVCANDGEEKRLREWLKEAGVRDRSWKYVQGDLSSGFLIKRTDSKSESSVYVTRSEIFGTRHKSAISLHKRARVQATMVDQILDFAALVEGDYLVHMQYGVCFYRGISHVDIADQKREVVTLEFDQGARLHLPLHEAHLLSRYVGLSKVTPRLGKISVKQWEKTRSAAERATLDFAADLLRLQAERAMIKGRPCAQDGDWQHEFEGAFEYKETEGQLTAIASVKQDMESEEPMDHLLCGDVGFGKTEVAIRATFKAVMSGMQVAIMSPTTVLTQQHFRTFCERMAGYPMVVEMLSRFRTPKQQKQIVEKLKCGEIDIVIGTHSLLANRVQFKNLGLLVIDEEHRFGVRHKEKLKQMRKHVDVLSMSATPIPRTLYMALMGARRLSVIETAPRDRLPIETFVKAYSDALVDDAMAREVERGGQVFYLHNRVQTIHKVAQKMQERNPKLRVAVGHGQMEESELEQVMTAFVDGQYDVMVCTTIIESGLDIPNCNTIIIEQADRLGLSQLYQLRGRVGRFTRQAYAYLLIRKEEVLQEDARKRLSSLRQHNRLGAGFRIAMRDLELRGAGHLLGEKQSGHIAGVGFDLYCQLLRQSIARLKGESFASQIRAQLRLDFVKMGESLVEESSGQEKSDFGVLKADSFEGQTCERIEARIAQHYMNEPRLRIEFYRKLAMAESNDVVSSLAEELEDRFGALDASVQALILMSQLRCLAERKGIVLVETQGDRLICKLAYGGDSAFLKSGNRFPRLTERKGLLRLREIIQFLQRQKDLITQ